MKQWYCLTCLVCGRRYPLTKFKSPMEPIRYPAQLVSGGGYRRGFRVVRYVPWAALPTLAQTDTWNSLLCLYTRLADSYDNFFTILGFLSPKMKLLMQTLRGSYADSYRASPYENYHKAFSPVDSSPDIAESYACGDYSRAYSQFLADPTLGGIQSG